MFLLLLLVVVWQMVATDEDPRYQACVRRCRTDLERCRKYFQYRPEKNAQCLTCYQTCRDKCRKLRNRNCPTKW